MNIEKAIFYLRPGNWLRLYRESKELSKLINDILDHPDATIKIKSRFVAEVGGLFLWIENFPYAYGRIQDEFYEFLGMLAVLDPDSEDWKKTYEIMQSHEKLRRQFEGKMPDRETVFRLHKAVEEAKLDSKVIPLPKKPLSVKEG